MIKQLDESMNYYLCGDCGAHFVSDENMTKCPVCGGCMDYYQPYNFQINYTKDFEFHDCEQMNQGTINEINGCVEEIIDLMYNERNIDYVADTIGNDILIFALREEDGVRIVVAKNWAEYFKEVNFVNKDMLS